MLDVENALYADSRLVDLYDLLNQGDWDYAFYSEQIGKQRRKVLDLGCGTGTFALRLAAAGHDVIAVDPSATMISYARRRPGSGAVEWMVGEAASAQDRAPFDVVTMTGHAFQCLLTDEEVHATLRTVREVLKAGGTFMFETRNPVTRPWTAWTPALSARSIQSDKYGPVDVFHDCIAVAEPLVEFETHYVFGRDNTQQISKSRLRFTSRDELASRIKLAGFREIEWFGNWSGGPFQEDRAPKLLLYVTREGPITAPSIGEQVPYMRIARDTVSPETSIGPDGQSEMKLAGVKCHYSLSARNSGGPILNQAFAILPLVTS